MTITFRPSQQKILTYRGGTMGIAAVPGAGKTFTLSALAAEIIARDVLEADQEVLIVTLVNSAVDNFSARVSEFITERGLLPRMGYRVRTLHGLAHDIVREKPALAGLDERFQIVDEREANRIRQEAADAWLAVNGEKFLETYLNPDLDSYQRSRVHHKELPKYILSLANAFIRSAKDRRLTPQMLRERLDALPPLPLAEMGWSVYADYQRALAYRGAVDFDDLIRLALDILEQDAEYLDRLRYRWPYILEDEAQDSSRLQEAILRLLSEGASEEENRGWVRVGDPNQAIFETFTTANPRYLRDFIAHEAEFVEELRESGRSQPSIIALANQMIQWVMDEHPVVEVRDALAPPRIRPAPKEDPRPNPPDDPAGIRFVGKSYTPSEEVNAVVDSIARWLPKNPQRTVAVLVPRNERGSEVINALRERGIPYVELLQSTLSTRAAAGALTRILRYLVEPQSARRLAEAYQVWRRDWREGDSREKALYKAVSEKLRRCDFVESYLFPQNPLDDWLSRVRESESDEEVLAELEMFREVVRGWQGVTLLPIDQMILTLSQEIFTDAADLALGYHLAGALAQVAAYRESWRLPELAAELEVIAKNERKFLGFDRDASGFDPERYRGVVTVATMHKAKGLEWDRVYLMSVNTYNFPSGGSSDSYISERWFVRDALNLEAEALAQLDAALSAEGYAWYEEGEATKTARLDYVRERLRLLYVGITRARRELIVTWNTGRRGDTRPALAFVALREWLRG